MYRKQNQHFTQVITKFSLYSSEIGRHLVKQGRTPNTRWGKRKNSTHVSRTKRERVQTYHSLPLFQPLFFNISLLVFPIF